MKSFLNLLIEATQYKTGQPITIDYIHNTQSATNTFKKHYGANYKEELKQFGCDVEPSGKYVSVKPSTFKSGYDLKWEEGSVTFKNPLVLDWGKGRYLDEDNWKQVLYKKYNKKGKELTSALIKDGYDGIITIKDGHVSEIVILSTTKI